MEQNRVKYNKDGTVSKGRGGKREGAGRKLNSKGQLSVVGLLDALKTKAKGKEYEDMLVEDFLKARDGNDHNLTLKYHNLLLSKLMNTLAKIEVTEGQDAIEAKKQAFAEALAKLTGIQENK
jgi:hypothetical protein